MIECLDLSEILNVVENEDTLIEWLTESGANYTFGGSNTMSLVDIEEFLAAIETARDENILNSDEFLKIDILIASAQESGIEFIDLES